ncbi:MAG TPA: sugar phosphate isomerase/epimerase [Terriglobia bacterium]|nr:sugar phosphate isomerase/epimerase [Terriglobia bacterium]
MKLISSPCTRREILKGVAKVGGAMLVPPVLTWGARGTAAGGYAPKLSVEGYIFLQHFDSAKQTLAAGEEEVLRWTHQAGYERVELSDPFFKADVRDQTRELLAKYKLKPESVYASSTLHEASAAEASIQAVLEVAAFLKPLGTRVIITNPSPKPNQALKTDAELKTQAQYINQLGMALRGKGIRLLLHHHTPELRENAREWWYELEHTDPQAAGCCVDVHWAYRGGQEVMPFLRKVGNRVESLHLRNSQNGVWMEDFGPGDVDYSPVADYLHQTNYQGFLVVELAYEKGTAVTRSLEEDLRRGRIYTEKVFGLPSS